MTGAPEGSPKVVLCGFMEMPGIEPATPGLQGIALIHYTTGASMGYLISLKWDSKETFNYLILSIRP